jgi:Spy/CpxP family protein refolding chaperone
MVGARNMNFSNPEWSLDMTHMNLRKTITAAVLIGASVVTANVMADPPQGPYYQGYGMGPGMMGGYGMAPGVMPYGMGPGMMGGYGMAPGVMPYGMGPGMMGGYGMAPGVMPYGMGPGMMGGYGVGAELNLTEEQRSQITKIQNELRQKLLEVMGKMQDEMLQMRELFTSNNSDEAALKNIFKKMSDLRQEMFDQLLSTKKQVNAVLTTEQLEILKGK